MFIHLTSWAERDMVRRLVPDGDFIEVFVDTAIEECMRRDPKDLYAKAKAGEITKFTGIGAPYDRRKRLNSIYSPLNVSQTNWRNGLSRN